MPDDDLTAAKILIVDDEPANVRLLERLLKTAGYDRLQGTSDPRTVLDLHRSFAPDLILLDLMMPHLDGVAVLGQLRGELPPNAYLPVLVLTADATPDAKQRALSAGAQDFLTKPFEQFEVLLRIRNLLNTRRLHVALEEQNRALEDIVRRRTEQLLQSEKVATMGSLLAGVAHELNNPLAVLRGQSQLLQAVVTDEGLRTRATKIDAAADRCVRIVRNFLALARQRPPERASVLLGDIVQDAVELLAYELRSDDVEVRLDVARDLPRLWADPHQLHQVFVNLIGNAHQAMRRGPRPRSIAFSARHDEAGERVRVEVTDTGPGIPEDVQRRIFEPFFTTKPTGEGTGLGLSLCRGIIEEHGGGIVVSSEVGRGTTFVIDLPLGRPTGDEAQAGDAAGPGAPPRIASKRVLVVDDEVGVAEVLAETLTHDGHRVDVAHNGAQALELLGQGEYDLVLSDTKMPVLDGEAFYAEMRRRWPALGGRIIFLTGDVLSREKREFLEATGAPFLAKPCDLREVRRLAHQILTR